MINEIGKQVKAGKSFVSDEAYDDILADDVKCRFRRVQSAHHKEYVCWSQWFYEGNDFLFCNAFGPTRMDSFPGKRGVMLKL